ncbi:MAG: GerMN domain-containing protein [Ignavibacteria bacterium]|nr:GerMN domain-containing protein [Ignavibacteria bacterium]
MKKFLKIISVFFLLLLLVINYGCRKDEQQQSEDVLTTPSTIYLVALEGTKLTGKTIGCNDILITKNINVIAKKTLLQATLDELLQYKEIDELKNFIKGPGLMLVQVTVSAGMADVYFKGDFLISGTCDIPRIKEQLVETAKKFTEYKKVNFYINNQTLDEYLSVANASF